MVLTFFFLYKSTFLFRWGMAYIQCSQSPFLCDIRRFKPINGTVSYHTLKAHIKRFTAYFKPSINNVLSMNFQGHITQKYKV